MSMPIEKAKAPWAIDLDTFDHVEEPQILKETILHVMASFDTPEDAFAIAALGHSARMPWRHVVAARDGAYRGEAMIDQSADYLRLPGKAAPRSRIAAVMAARRVLTDHRPDILMTYGRAGLPYMVARASLAGVVSRHVHIEDGSLLRLPQGIKRAFVQDLMGRADVVLVPTRHMAMLAHTILKVEGGALAVVPPGVAAMRFDRFADLSLLHGAGVPKGVPLIGATTDGCELEPLCRLIDAVAMARRFTPCHLAIFASSDRQTAERLAAHASRIHAKDVVTIIGPEVPRARVLTAFDVFVSVSQSLAPSIAVLEAMAAGAPIVAADTMDLQETLCSDNRDYIVPPTAHALAKAVTRLLRDKRLARIIGLQNRARAQDMFNESQLAAGLEAALL